MELINIGNISFQDEKCIPLGNNLQCKNLKNGFITNEKNISL